MSNPPIYEELLEKLVRVYEGSLDRRLTDFQIPTAAYTNEPQFQAERRLLRTLPMVVAHVSQLQAAGSCLVHDALGVPIVVTRDREGEDLWVCQQIQKGLGSGANEFLTYGIEEAPIQWWHEELTRRIEGVS